MEPHKVAPDDASGTLNDRGRPSTSNRPEPCPSLPGHQQLIPSTGPTVPRSASLSQQSRPPIHSQPQLLPAPPTEPGGVANIDISMAGPSPQRAQTSTQVPSRQTAPTAEPSGGTLSGSVPRQPVEVPPSLVILGKGKARASLSKMSAAPQGADAPPPSSANISQQRRLGDEHSGADGMPTLSALNVRVVSACQLPESLSNPISPVSAHPLSHAPVANPHSSSSGSHLPLQSPLDEDLEDDEVEPIDRGEALVRRRMKERHRIKKEAERRQRQLDEESRARPRASTTRARPTASRTKTAPGQIAHHTLPVAGASRTRASLSRESLWAHAGSTPRDSLSTADDRLSSSHHDSAPSAPDVSSTYLPPIQSTYQSFGSPSQFRSASLKNEDQLPLPPTSPSCFPLAQPRGALPPHHGANVTSSGHRRFSSQRQMSGSDRMLPEDHGNEDTQQLQGVDHFCPRTPTTRGRHHRAPPMSAQSVGVGAPPEVLSSRHSHSRSQSGIRRRPSSVGNNSVADEVSSEEESGAEPEADQLPSPAAGQSDTSSVVDEEDVEYTLKDRQDAINIEHPFGLPIWKPALYKKSRSVARDAEAALHNSPTSTAVSTLKFGNLMWSMSFGVWLALVFAIVAAVLFVIPWGGSKYGRVVWELAWYLVWPFGKYVEEWSEDEDDATSSENVAAESGDNVESNGHPSRWIVVSEIGEDETASVDRLTIRGEMPRDDEHSALAPGAERSSHPDYGTLNSHTSEPRETREPQPHLSPDLTTFLSLFNPKYAHQADLPKRKIRIRALGRLSFWAAYYLIIAPLMLFACLLCWFFVVTIPMAKLLWILVRHVGAEPLALHFRSPPTYIDLEQLEVGGPPGDSPPDCPTGTLAAQSSHNSAPAQTAWLDSSLPPQLKPGQPAPKHSKKSLSESRAKGRLVSGKAKVLLCTYKALGLQYYKYTIDGVNIMFIILMPLVIFVILDAFYLVPLKPIGFLGVLASQGVIFLIALLSVIPLSYFIGMAVASISAQSSIGMGAVINATFGSIIEILLYGIALTEGKGELVEGSIIGSVLAGVLLMPGLSMIGGSVRRKEQKFNARSAGVTSTMLIMAIIGTLTPTLFYEIYGTFQLSCSGCPSGLDPHNPNGVWQCKSCRYVHLGPVDDDFYQNSVKGLSYYCAILLVLSYLIGLWFSLRTHASQIWQTPAVAQVAEHSSHLPSSAAHAHLGTLTGHGDHQYLLGGLTHQQRMSTYVRRLPEIVKQQLLPHLHRPAPSTHLVPSERAAGVQAPSEPSLGEGTPKADDSKHQSQPPPDLSLTRTLTAEEVDQTLKILEMASTAQLHALHHSPGHVAISRPPVLADGYHHSLGSASRSTSKFLGRQHPPQELVDSQAVGVAALPEEQSGSGHDAPNWSRMKSTTVLLTCTLLYAIIAEILVSGVDVVLNGSGIPEKLLGVTLFALVPNTTEFMNAISFAINGNIALSMEIGSAYALQVCLIQIPAMIAISSIYNSGRNISAHHAFTLIFPRWDVISIIFSVFLLTYTYIEARANYYRGSILVLSYLVLIGGFYSAPVSNLDASEHDLGSGIAGVTQQVFQANRMSLWLLPLIPWKGSP